MMLCRNAHNEHDGNGSALKETGHPSDTVVDNGLPLW